MISKAKIICMAREVSSKKELPWNGEWIFRSQKELIQFAQLVAEQEREACAQVAEKMRCDDIYCQGFANAIRARGPSQ